MYIVEKEQKDKKNKFSAFELELKPNTDVSFQEIKKVGTGKVSDAGNHHTLSRSRYESSTDIKSNNKKKSK